MAWGVDIEPVIAMVSAAFGKYLCFFFLQFAGLLAR